MGEDEVLGVALQLGRAGRLRVEVEVDAVVARDALADVVAAAAPELLHLEVARQPEEALHILGRQMHCNNQQNLEPEERSCYLLAALWHSQLHANATLET